MGSVLVLIFTVSSFVLVGILVEQSYQAVSRTLIRQGISSLNYFDLVSSQRRLELWKTNLTITNTIATMHSLGFVKLVCNVESYH